MSDQAYHGEPLLDNHPIQHWPRTRHWSETSRIWNPKPTSIPSSPPTEMATDIPTTAASFCAPTRQSIPPDLLSKLEALAEESSGPTSIVDRPVIAPPCPPGLPSQPQEGNLMQPTRWTIPFDPKADNDRLIREREKEHPYHTAGPGPSTNTRCKFYFDKCKEKAKLYGDMELLRNEAGKVCIAASDSLEVPPIGEIRIDGDGQRLYCEDASQPESIWHMTRGSPRTDPLIRLKAAHCYKYPYAASERAWHGIVDIERQQTDEKVIERRLRRSELDVLGPENRNAADEKAYECLCRDDSLLKDELLADLREDYAVHEQNNMNSGPGAAPHEGAFHAQSDYIEQLLRLDKDESYQDVGFDVGRLPSYPVHVNGVHDSRESSDKLEETVRNLDELMDLHPTGAWYEDVYIDLVLLEHMIETREPPLSYPDQCSDLLNVKHLRQKLNEQEAYEIPNHDLLCFRSLVLNDNPRDRKEFTAESDFKQELQNVEERNITRCRSRFVELCRDFDHLEMLMKTHVPPGRYNQVHDDFLLLQDWAASLATHNSNGLYDGIHVDVHNLRAIITTRNEPWLFPGIEKELVYQRWVTGRFAPYGLHPLILRNVADFKELSIAMWRKMRKGQDTGRPHPIQLIEALIAAHPPGKGNELPGVYPRVLDDVFLLYRLLKANERLRASADHFSDLEAVQQMFQSHGSKIRGYYPGIIADLRRLEQAPCIQELFEALVTEQNELRRLQLSENKAERATSPAESNSPSRSRSRTDSVIAEQPDLDA